MVGVSEKALGDPDGRVPVEAVYCLLEHLVDRTEDELTPLRLACTIEPGDLDALGLLALTSPTLGDALEATIRYQRVFVEGERYRLETIGDRVHVRYEPWGTDRRGHHAMADMFVRDLGVNLPMLIGAAPAAVRLRHHPSDPGRHAALLGVVAELGAPVDEVVYPHDTLATPIPRADALLASFFERYLDERLARLPEVSRVSRVLVAIEQSMSGGSPSLGSVARRMRVSTRTLQRWLADEQTSFAALVEEVRRSRSLVLIESGRAIAEVAFLLGYSEASAFHRAFRRWTGTTPSAWRERARGADA